MIDRQRIRRRVRGATTALAAMALLASAACASAGGLGNVLGSVLGGMQGSQVSGTVQNVDTQSQQISLQQPDGSAVALSYDNNTKVVYQDRVYAVSNLERGDQIVARVQQSGTNRGYYTDSLQVTQSVSSSTNNGSVYGNGGSETVQSLQGTVRQLDRTNGTFSLDAGTGVTLLVSMPYNANRSDVDRFNSLRIGDAVRLQGVYLNNSRVELRRFY
jgi:hypothetical protein